MKNLKKQAHKNILLLIRCRTNAGFGLEEFEEAEKKVEFLKSLGEVVK